MSKRTIAVLAPVLLAVVMLIWGMNWPGSSSNDCASGTYFLADLGWVFEGVVLAFVLAGGAATVLAASVGGAPALGATALVILLLAAAGRIGGVLGSEGSGCPDGAEDVLWALAIAAAIGALIGYPVGWAIQRLARRVGSSPGS